ncbi:MAG: endonuclease/exonuclease/phosphatase family protein [Myxococcales bacterium]|nr:endonuclease/exonuclease/phosphatase family protein [Myxococcales bacterium]MCB9576693.1 endonuclease/exonuclease/phosphatase family protein [Polyangiaceae bacterium]
MRFSVVTWNIHKGIGGVDRRYRLERTIEVLSKLAPDIALLQEVAADMPRSRFHDQADLLASELGMPHVAYGAEHRFSVGGYGNAILSRWPLYDIHHLDLTVGTRKKRGALQAKARVRFGNHSRTVVLHNLHLGLAGSERGRQLERFLSSHPFRGLHGRTPVVLGGDLNDLWGTLGPSFLNPAGFSRAGPLARTFPAWLPVRPLDGLFVRGDVRVRHAGPARGTVARQASDHLPLGAELELFAY